MIRPAILKLAVLVLLTYAYLDSHSQGVIPTKGKEFWMGFMSNYTTSTQDSLILFVSSEFNTTGTVSIPQAGYMQNFSVTANVTTKLYVPTIYEHLTSEVVEGKGILVETLDDVALFAINFQDYTTDGTKILPTKSLGTDYQIMAWEGLGSANTSELLIVSTEDGTQVEITPTVPTAGGNATGVPFMVQLDRGESYQVQAVNGTSDLTGTTVIATDSSGDCRPFAVFSGSECVNVPIGCTYCDHIFEQNFSTDTWGEVYYIVPFFGSTSHTYRIMALDNGTVVTVNGGAPINLTAGQYVTYSGVSTASCVQSNKPINVTQYMEGFNCGGVGDPAMLILNSEDQKIDNITFSTVQSNVVTNHYSTVIMKTAHAGQLTLNGNPVGTGTFTAFPNCPTLSYAHVTLTPGSHTLDADSGFTAYVYGTGQHESYAYSVGSFNPAATIDIDSVYCTTDTVTIGTTEPLYGAWWTTLSQPNDTVAMGTTIQIVPTSNELYILHGYSLLTGCLVEEFYNVEIPIPPTLTVTQSADTVCRYQEVQLTTTVSPPGSYNYTWTPAIGLDDPHSANPIATVTDDIEYVLTVSSLGGCANATDTINLYAIGGSITTFDATTDITPFCAGDTAQLNAVVEEVLYEDPLDTFHNASLWNNISTGIVSQDCGSVSGDALYFNGGGTRYAETVDMDVSNGGTVYYYLKIGSGVAPCDDADFGEDVVLEFSTNGGGIWAPITTHYEYNTLTFISFSAAIPFAAQTASTRFRWRQVAHSGVGQDNWALDEVLISRTEVGGFQFTWTPSAGLSSTTSQSPQAFRATTTQYTVSMVDTNSGCDYADSILLEVGQPFTLATTDDTVLCQTSGVSLSATPSAGSGHTYTWTPDATLSSGAAANPLATPVNTVTYYVSVTSDLGCFAEDSVTVTVPSLAQFAIDPNTASLCIGDTAQVNASFLPSVCGTNGSLCNGGEDSVQIGTGGFSSSSSAITPFYGFSGKRTQIIYTAAELAGGTTGGRVIQGIALETAGFIGNPNEYLDFEIRMKCTSTSVATSTFETGTQVVFTAKPVIITGGWNYFTFDNTFDWDGVSNVIVDICYNSENAASSTSVMYSIMPTQMVTYRVSAVACQETTGFATTNRPAIQFNYCQPQLPDLVYTWSPSISVSDVNDPDAFLMPTTNTLYTLNALDTATGCAYSDNINITVAPAFNLTMPNDTTLCDLSGVILDTEVDTGITATYSWSPSNTLSNSSIADPLATPTQTTQYSVTATSSGCVREGSVLVSIRNPATLDIQPDGDTICLGQSVIATSTFDRGCGPSGSTCGSPSIGSMGTAVASSSISQLTPFSAQVASSKKQYILSVADLNAMGALQASTLESLAFDVLVVGTTTQYEDFTIKMGCTSFSSFVGTFEGNLSTVFDPKTITVVAGWNTFAFDNTFDWDGVSNIVVEICYDNPVGGFSSSVYYYNSGVNTNIYSTGASVCNDQFGINYSWRPVMQIGYCSTPTSNLVYSWSPSVGVLDDTASSTTITPIGTQLYTLTATDTAVGCIYTDDIYISVINPNFSAHAGNDTTLCSTVGHQLQVTENSGGAVSIQWQPGSLLNDSTIANPTMTADTTVTFIVYVGDSAGCATATDTITITSQGNPTLQIISDTSVCEGDSVQLWVNGANTYSWSPAASLDNAASNMPWASPATTTTYTVTGTDNFGCQSTTTVDVSVTPFETVFLGNDTSVCPGETVELQAPAGFASYQWQDNSNGTSFTVTTAGTYWVVATNPCGQRTDTIVVNNFVNTPVEIGPDTTICFGQQVNLDAGTYDQYTWSNTDTTQTITISDSGLYYVDVVDANGCTSSDSMTLSVSANPSFSLRSDTIICAPDSITIGATLAFTSYDWSTGDTTSHITVFNSDNYILTITNMFGCSSSDTVAIGGVQPLIPDLGNDTTICDGQTVTLSTGISADSYLWSNANVSATISATDSSTYWVQTTDSNQCVASDTVIVHVLQPPSLELGNDTSVCSPETVVLYATSGMTSYNWSDGSTSDSLVVTMSDTVWVAISSANGCTSSDTIIVTVNTPPTVNLGNDTAVCSGQSVNLDAGHPGSMYNWSNAAGTQQISVTVDNEYWVVVTDGNNCTGSDTVDVTVHTLPTVNTNSDTTICEGQSVSLTATGASQYQWSPGTDLSATTGAMVVSTPSSDISYSVVGTDTNGCVGSANVSITVINIPPVSISGDTVCQGQTVTLNAGNQHTGYLWSNAAVTNSITVNTSGDYWVVASNQCGSVSDTATVLIAQAPVVSLGNDTTVCANTGYRLSVPNDPWHSYQWSTGDNVNWIEPENPGSFTLTVTNQFNCSSTTSIDLGMKWLPELKLPTDTFLCSDNGASQLLVDLTGLELDSLRWNTGNREEVLTIRQPGNYQVLAYHFCGTQSEGLTVDEEFCECNVYVPSGFSPNKDGLNDILRPLFKCEYVDFTFSVFNRWGQKVYETSERNEGWDGFFKERQQPMGVYVYQIEIRGVVFGNVKRFFETGNVTLIR